MRRLLMAGGLCVVSAGIALAGTYDAQLAAAPPVAVPSAAPAEVQHVADEAKHLQDMVKNPIAGDAELRAHVDKLFDAMPDAEQTRVQPYKLREDWQKQVFDDPDQKVRDKDQRTGDDSMMISAFYQNTLATNDVPLPIMKDIEKETGLVRAMKGAGLVGYDLDGFLGKGTLGAYVYNPMLKTPIGIFLHDDLRIVASYLGDTLAGMTVVAHEGGHALRDLSGGLNPKHTIDDEVDAFNRQADALIAWDRDGKGHMGHRLARFWAMYVEGRVDAPKVVGQVVQHLAKMRAARENNKMEEFVKALGYHNHSTANAEHLTAEHGDDHAPAEQHAEHAGVVNPH